MNTTWAEDHSLTTYDAFVNFNKFKYRKERRYVYDVIVPALKEVIESQEGPVTWKTEYEIAAYDYSKYMPISESEWLEENPDGDYTEYEFNRVNEILDELFVEYSMPKDTADDDDE